MNHILSTACLLIVLSTSACLVQTWAGSPGESSLASSEANSIMSDEARLDQETEDAYQSYNLAEYGEELPK